jgi:hypothetical protein
MGSFGICVLNKINKIYNLALESVIWKFQQIRNTINKTISFHNVFVVLVVKWFTFFIN